VAKQRGSHRMAHALTGKNIPARQAPAAARASVRHRHCTAPPPAWAARRPAARSGARDWAAGPDAGGRHFHRPPRWGY
jgi:hypothetical protein